MWSGQVTSSKCKSIELAVNWHHQVYDGISRITLKAYIPHDNDAIIKELLFEVAPIYWRLVLKTNPPLPFEGNLSGILIQEFRNI